MKPFSIPRWQGEAAICLCLTAFGAAWLFYSRTIPFLAEGRPGPGFAPIVLACGCVALGLAGALLALRGRGSEMISLGERTALLTAIALIITVSAFERIGFLPATVFMLASLFWVVGQIRPLKALITAAAAALLTWAVFVKALGVRLPQGIMPF